ncbi:MAG: sigma-54 dependent transcriptional regulator [Ignavibacteriales bacterium]|nr:sigma-54 dependent transcriptional regulator [Ignavibacteriales bacterium]
MDRLEFQRQHGIIGRSLEIQEIVDVVQQVAPTDITVLITGESGVGKEVIARALHTASKRAKNQLVTVNCGAIPEGLIESELFGHEKGSFTSAVENRKGYFEIADGGTIFLDEIGETPLATQVKLLRVLESGEFMRVGSSLSRTSNARVIAATNKELQYEVQQKRFRPDLYFRLRSVNIFIPPLRDRREDIPLLIEHFVNEALERNGIRFEGFTDDATELIMNYRWPGNVRELKNSIESMLILENGRRLTGDGIRKYLKDYQGQVVDRNLPVVANKTVEQAERELIYRALVDLKGSILELRDVILNGVTPSDAPAPTKTGHSGGNGALSLDAMERKMIMSSLDRHNGNRRLAAEELNISERTLYRKIKEFGLQE